MNLLTRFFLALLLGAVLPVLVTGVWFLRSNERAEENAKLLHQQIATLASDMVEAAAADMNVAFSFVVDLERGGRRNEAEDLRVLQKTVTMHPSFILLAILDAEGREGLKISDTEVFSDPSRADRSREGVVLAALGSGKFSLGEASLVEGIPVLTMAYPLMDGRCIYAVYRLSPLFKRLTGMKVGEKGRVAALRPDGSPLPGCAPEFVPAGWKAPAEGPQSVGFLDRIRVDGGEYVGAYARSATFGWRILTLQPRGEALAFTTGFKLRATLFLGLISILVVLEAIWLAGKLTRPLTSLIEGAKRVSRNDFSSTVPPVGWGELSRLAGSFNEMMLTLKSYQQMQVDRLFEEKAKIEALVQTIPDGILLAGFDGTVAYMNASSRALLRPSPGQRTVHEFITHPDLREMMSGLLSRRKRNSSAELEISDPQGKRLGLFACQGVSVMRESREIGVLLLMRDVTAERELDRMKQEFFHSIVHDLRSPIASIDGFVSMMKARGLNDKEKRYLDYVRSSIQMLSLLVDNILTAAQIDSGSKVLNVSAVDPPELLDRIRVLYTLQTDRAGIELRLKSPPGPGQSLDCDRGLVERVLMNLVGNALKFTPAKGFIEVRYQADGGTAEFSVTDSGPGIPQDKLGLIFERFRQLDSGAKRSGYGIGLSTCKKIVDLHGGTIWAESKPGQGASFRFRIPASRTAA